MSFACTSVNNESLSTSILSNKKATNEFHSIFNKPRWNQLQPDHERNPRSDAGCAGTTGQSQPAFDVSNLRNRTKHTLLIRILPSSSEMTPSMELLKHPVVKQLAMIGTQKAVLEQDHRKSANELRWHDSRAVSKELPRQTR